MTGDTDERVLQEAQDVTIIALMGITGAGKSSFINKAASTSLTVGYSLEPCTSDIKQVEFTLDGRDVILIDSPGFDDTRLTDIDILEKIGHYLKQGSERKMFLTGVIYMHRITDNRVAGSAERSLRILRKLCVDNYANLALVTSKWDVISKAEGEDREKQLRGDGYWGEMIRRGAKVGRHSNSEESAIEILRGFFLKKKIVLKFQEEFDKHGIVGKTAAGEEIISYLREDLEKYKSDMRKLIEEHEKAKADNAKIERYVESLRKDIERMEQETRKREREKMDILNDLKKKESINDSLEAELQNLKKEVGELKLTMGKENLADKSSRLEEMLIEHENARSEAEGRVQDLTAEIERLQQDKREKTRKDDLKSKGQVTDKGNIEEDKADGEMQDLKTETKQEIEEESAVDEDLRLKKQAVKEAGNAKSKAEGKIRDLKAEIEEVKQDMEMERVAAEGLELKGKAIEEAKNAKGKAERRIKLLTEDLEGLQSGERRAGEDLSSKEMLIEEENAKKNRKNVEIQSIEKDINEVGGSEARVTNGISRLENPVTKRWQPILPRCTTQ